MTISHDLTGAPSMINIHYMTLPPDNPDFILCSGTLVQVVLRLWRGCAGKSGQTTTSTAASDKRTGTSSGAPSATSFEMYVRKVR